jgi:hypothetical protein
VAFCEDLGEAAAGHRGPNFDSMAGLLEEVRVDVQGDRRAGVAEDAADLANVETQVDDQMADLAESGNETVQRGAKTLGLRHS